jgi:hypothetical protein
LEVPVQTRIHTQRDADVDDYDLESVAPSTSSHRISRDSYGYEKKKDVRGYDDDIEMDSRSEVEFEE